MSPLDPLSTPGDTPAPHATPGRAPTAVIGAGLAGLLCARTLASRGCSVRVFDKGRGPAGRCATRRHRLATPETTPTAPGTPTTPGQPWADHGAQYFTARDRRTAPLIESWQRSGVIQPWHPNAATLTPHGPRPLHWPETLYIGTPTMSALGAHHAEDLDVRWTTPVSAIEPRNGRWHVRDDAGETLGEFNRAILALPPAQAAALLPTDHPFRETVSRVRMQPCWAAVLSFDTPLDPGYDAASIELPDSPLAWIANEARKPGRPSAPTWVVHARADWSNQHLESSADEVLGALVSAFASATASRIRPARAMAHRWRYARAAHPLGRDCLWDAAAGLGLCGDWCLGARIEAALLSGMSLAGCILGDRLPDDGKLPLDGLGPTPANP